jgi:hypothetical protein
MSEETPNFNIDPGGGMTAPAKFTYKGRRVEIVPPDTRHLIGNYWQSRLTVSSSAICCLARYEVRRSERKN